MSSPACWTCRLRRKKCDRIRPVCAACAGLDIDCHYSAVKPEWMDGGQKQHDMAKAIKAQVRQGSSSRRDKEFSVQVLPLGESSTSLQPPPSHDSPASTGSAAPVHATGQDETDDFLMTLYLDTVFPFLFPWYKPTNISGGRTWLLAILKGQLGIKYTALSISAYYFTLTLAKDVSHTLRTPCEQHVWDTLALHMKTSLKIIRQDMDGLNKHTKADVFRQTHVLGGIVQLLIFETIMARGGDWNMHLAAALALFNDIFETHGMKDGQHDLGAVLRAMGQDWPFFNGAQLGFSVWTADQASFQFFTAFLIFADIISSVPLKAPPQLRRYHSSLISDNHPSSQNSSYKPQGICMEDYVGCPGWVLITLGEVARLESLKHSAEPIQRAGIAEVVRNQSIELERMLEDGLFTMSNSTSQAQNRVPVVEAWIHATILHLTIVVEGWDPLHPKILHSAQRILEIISTIPWQLSLRSIMWPFCVAGCLAAPEQEDMFRSVVSAMGPFQAFGTAKEALGLMERVWGLRNQLDKDSWSLCHCFEVDGVKFLLI
ncbi:uncharacterized protein NECHADRAFT_83501 [Fusarium vanettenii 77-13-4]|uniref:Zn(2)-C6 fungal-type domain-containing protein n=1 Tax=Fusarium vanettenii (strain ATCC MYA-4622 / CBS 123669 / FGSC 9596 / NRRL 45880 / 77-13-4) TaxID=660122 RepID=C7Z470_FUSV7|nr:uncharacterized protein NECHADRAFT_83501 [Fusarium vanettenii 77-13-4]EEU41263.1 hypothetical protein NECHADRAFT_83501 [Fusarium vanettenii 77-13-4]